jgi:hypothetical protein
MNTKEDKQKKSKDFPKRKMSKNRIDSIESKNIRHQRHDFKYKKIDMEEEELWAEWQEYYK